MLSMQPARFPRKTPHLIMHTSIHTYIVHKTDQRGISGAFSKLASRFQWGMPGQGVVVHVAYNIKLYVCTGMPGQGVVHVAYNIKLYVCTGMPGQGVVHVAYNIKLYVCTLVH